MATNLNSEPGIPHFAIKQAEEWLGSVGEVFVPDDPHLRLGLAARYLGRAESIIAQLVTELRAADTKD